ncbi:unnamed protein product [Oikopleura dioica]|uniref:DBF4-type domain-containing protein n=1 Tax=Oikopleura dioica TaxID=34765 RepID=E4Y578_OIKDI|nr:unnamed protein product [Oikopleura dioica]
MDNLKSGFERRSDPRLGDKKAGTSSASNGASPELNRFKGKIFYFDDECQREITYKDLVRWLKYIGADVEEWSWTNKITHYISKSGRKPEAEKPGPIRRPPVRSRALSRKDLILAAVNGAKSASPAAGSNISPPEKRGIRYFSYDKLIPLVKRQVRAVKESKKSGAKRNSLDSNKGLDSPVKSPKVTKPKKPSTAYPQTSRRSLFIETKKEDSKKLLKQTQKTYLKDNFIKITDESEKFRPIFKDKMQEQILSRERIPYNKCPFVGSMTHEERKAKRDSLQLQKLQKLEALSSSAKTTSAIDAGAKNDASKTLATMWKNGGTCEICNYSRYEDPAEHFESDVHKKNISNYEARFRMIDKSGLELDSGIGKEEANGLSKTQLRVKIIQHRMKKFAEMRKANPCLADLERMKSPVSQEETAFRDTSMQKLREKRDEEAEKQEEIGEKEAETTNNQAPVPVPIIDEEPEKINVEKDVQEKLTEENFHKIDDSFEICLKKPKNIIDEEEEEIEKQHENTKIEEKEVLEEKVVEDIEESEAENDDDAQSKYKSCSQDDEMMDATEALKSTRDDEETRDSWVITSRYTSPQKPNLSGSISSATSPQKTIKLFNFEDSGDSSSDEEIKPRKTKPKRLSTFIHYSSSSSDEDEEQLRLPKTAPRKIKQNDSSFNLDTTNEEIFNQSQEIPKPRIIYPKRKRSETASSPQLLAQSPGIRSPARKRSQRTSNLEFDRIEILNVEEPVNVIDDMLRSSPIHEEIKEPVKQNEEDCQPIFEQKGQIQEDQTVPCAGENDEDEEESTVEAATESSVTVKHDFKRRTWNFEHFGSDENSHISGFDDGSLQNSERITPKSERGCASIQFSDESNSTKMSCIDSTNFVEELLPPARKPIKYDRPFVFSSLERPTDNNEENQQNETLCTVAEDASFNLSLNHTAHHGSINLEEEEDLPDENKPWNHPCHFPPKRYASLKSEVQPETLIQMISEEQEQFNRLEKNCDPKTRYYSSFIEMKTTELIDRRVAEGRAKKGFILGSCRSDELKKRRSSVLAANRTSACLIQQKSSSPEPNDFEENAQCSWDHSMDKNGVHTLQVEQRSELGISGSFDSHDLDSRSNQASKYLH